MKTKALRLLLYTLLALPLNGLAAPSVLLSGSVIDSLTGRPLSGVNVSLDGPVKWGVTDDDGRFGIAGVTLGEHFLAVNHIGYKRLGNAVQIAASGADLSLRLTPQTLPGRPVLISATRATRRRDPVTFSNISQEDIKDRYTTQDIPVLLSELPSTTFRSDGGNGIGYNYVNIRGFDQRRVAVSINGVPQNDPGDHNVYWIDFPDLAANLQDIQVQRGAGLSHYGSAAIGGSVDLVTSNYSPTPRYSLFAGVGSYGTRKYSIEAHTGLLSDRYSLYGRLSRIETDGYRDLSWVRLNSFFVGGAYFGLEQTLRLHAYGGPLEDHLAYYGVPKSYVDSTEIVRRQNLWLARNDETERFHQPQLQLLHDWQLSPTARLSNTFFYIRGTGYFDFTGDWWADFGYLRLDDDPEVSAQLLANSLHPSSIFVRDSILRWYVGKQQWGWVPRISLDHGRGTVDVGGDLRVHTAKHWGRLQKADADSAAMDASGNPLPINMPDGVVGRHRYYEYNTDKLITSAFVHSTYDLSPRVTLSGDLQCVYKCYTMRGEKFVTTPRRFDVPFSFVNPRVGANVNLTDAVNLYATIARTSREPRQDQYYDPTEAAWGSQPNFDTTSVGELDYGRPLIKPERLTDFEIGIGLAEPNYRAGANLYWMDFRDELIKQGGIDKFGQPTVGNAERAVHQGIEITGAARLLGRLELSGNLSVSDNVLKEYTTFVSDSVGSFNTAAEFDNESRLWALNYDGNSIAGFPGVMGNVRATYKTRGATSSLHAQYVGRQYTDNTERKTYSVDPYWVMNASLAYGFWYGADITLKLQANNVLGAKYATGGEGDGFFPAATRNYFLAVEMKM